MRKLSTEEKNAVQTIQLILSLQDVCKKLVKDTKDYLVNIQYKPKKEKSLWLALAQTFNIWERERLYGATVDAGSQNIIEAATICKRLSKIECAANTVAQLNIAEYLGISLHALTFGLSFRHNLKAITAGDLPRLVRAIDLVLPDVIACVDSELLDRAVANLGTKKVIENDIDLELFTKVIGVKDAHTPDEIIKRYESFLNGFRTNADIESKTENSMKVTPVLEAPDAYLRTAMRDIGIGSMPIPETSDIELIDETVHAVERAFYETLVRKKTHVFLVNELVDLARNDL